MRRSVALLTALLGSLIPVPAADAGAEQALQDEMERSLEKLRLADEPRPYFLSYRLDDVEVLEVGASFGSPLRQSRDRYRMLSAELRVGSAARDNSNFFSFSRGSSGVTRSWNGSLRVPMDDDYRELRRHAWLLTDGTYKTALENLARKTAALENRRVPGDLPDFAAAKKASVVEILERPAIDQQQAAELVTGVSRAFREQPVVNNSLVRLRAVRQHARYLNSEGSTFERAVPMLELSISASTQAADGTLLADAVAHYGHSLADLPPRQALEEEVGVLGNRLAMASSADQLERYNGPVLFTGQAAAEIFHQTFAPGLAAWRSPVSEDERLEQRLAAMNASLTNRLGGRVLSRSMRLIDDPRADDFDGRPLYGGYDVDDEGVPSSPTLLVERGILKALVASRNPVRGAPATTGNRRGASALPSNLLLSTSEGKSYDDLIAELYELMNERELEFGVIVRRIANPILARILEPRGAAGSSGASDGAVRDVVEAVKIYPDGREEPLRDPRFSGLTAASFRDIVETSRRLTVYSAPLRPEHAGVALMSSATLGSALTGPPVVSVVVPDLLFEELTIAAPVEPVPRAPVIPHPYFDD